MKKLEEMYDGYHFSKKGDAVYNPFSLLNAFEDREFGSYWYSTGTPTSLIHSLTHSIVTAEQFTDDITAKEAEISDPQIENQNPVPLFYQSGY